MLIIKSKRKSKCRWCEKMIDGKYKVESGSSQYHLSCYKKHADRTFLRYKNFLKELKKPKYKKHLILEKLEC